MKRIVQDATRRPDDRRPDALTAWNIATWIWVTGAVIVSCYLLIGHFAAWRLYRTTRTIKNSWVPEAQRLAKELGFKVRILESEQLSVPIVLHLWRSIIIMPTSANQWPWLRIRAVLLHELAHIKRNDLHVQGLANLASCLYWFNPLVWFAARQLRVERERACDDLVLLDGTSRADYATHLFEIASAVSRRTVVPFAIGLAVHRSLLEQRLVAIMNPRTPRHSTTILCRLMVALPMLLLALAAGAVQITAGVVKAPSGTMIPIQVSHAARLLIGGIPENSSVPVESSAGRNSLPEAFDWVGTMHRGQTIDVHLGRGSIRVLPSKDDTVRVQARTNDPHQSEIQTVSIPNGVKFCNVVTRDRKSINYCEPRQSTSQIQENQPVTEFVIYVPTGLQFFGSTVRGDITAEHPSTDSSMAIVDGNITFELAPGDGANFNGNIIKGTIDSDFPLNDNAPALPNGEGPVNMPRIVHGTLGRGGPRLTATVVNGNIRVLRQSTE